MQRFCELLLMESPPNSRVNQWAIQTRPRFRTTITKHALVEINYQPGTEIIPPVVAPEVGARDPRLKDPQHSMDKWSIVIECRRLAGETYDIDIVSPRRAGKGRKRHGHNGRKKDQAALCSAPRW